MFTMLGVLASVALAAGLVGLGSAQADKKDGGASARAGDAVVGDGEVRAGNAVVDEDGARIEGDPPVDGNEEQEGAEEGGSGDNGNEEGQESAPVGEGEVVLKLKGDEGVGFSGTCSVGGEEKEISGQVPEEFTFVLDGDELQCELRKEGGDGTLKTVILSDNGRSVQSMNGEGTLKFTYSGDGISSSMSSGSSSVVNQSSSVTQSGSSSTGR